MDRERDGGLAERQRQDAEREADHEERRARLVGGSTSEEETEETEETAETSPSA